MPARKALSMPQMHRAAELYRDGKSRRQVAAILGKSEEAVKTALREMGVRMRDRLAASNEAHRRIAGHCRKAQVLRMRSVFELGASL